MYVPAPRFLAESRIGNLIPGCVSWCVLHGIVRYDVRGVTSSRQTLELHNNVHTGRQPAVQWYRTLTALPGAGPSVIVNDVEVIIIV